MKRSELLRQIREVARRAGLNITLVRQGSVHEIWKLGDQTFPLPRHTELSSGVERSIKRDLEAVLGKDWWRR